MSWDLPIDEIRGIAWSDGELLALDAKQHAIRTFHIEHAQVPVEGRPRLLPKVRDPRGLIRVEEGGRSVLYLLSAGPSLIRIDGEQIAATLLPGLKGRKVFSLARTADAWFITYDPGRDPATGGLARYDGSWSDVAAGKEPVILPSAGRIEGKRAVPTDTIAAVPLDGEPYLMLVAGDHGYVAQVPTGRGLWTLPWSRAAGHVRALAMGDKRLWAAIDREGPDRIVAIDVLSDASLPWYGPWRMRDVTFSIAMEPASASAGQEGWLQHTMQLPADTDTQRRLGFRAGPSTDGVMLESLPWSPADDPSAPMLAVQARWTTSTLRSRYESAVTGRLLWRDARYTVLPHRATDEGLLPGYLADDPLYGLDHADVFDRFVDRVVSYTASSYGMTEEGVRSELTNPYWAARDIVDYIFATYWYPSEEVEAPSDPSEGIFPSNPAWAKALASEGPTDGDEILMCASASTLFDGTMRHLGHAARWVGSTYGTGKSGITRTDDSRWDTDNDGFLEPGERQMGTNGHRWAQAWLGPNFGWIAFDATPKNIALSARDTASRPPRPTQWTLMGECAGPSEHKIISSLGSGTFEPLLSRPEGSGIHGEQTYNMLGTASQPKRWRHPEHRVTYDNPLGLSVRSHVEGQQLTISWTLTGPWELLPDPTLEIRLASGSRTVELARHVPAQEGHFSFPMPPGEEWRVIVTLEGDRLTGAQAVIGG